MVASALPLSWNELIKLPFFRFILPKQFSDVPYLYPEYTTDEPIADHEVTLFVSELNLLSSCDKTIVLA